MHLRRLQSLFAVLLCVAVLTTVSARPVAANLPPPVYNQLTSAMKCNCVQVQQYMGGPIQSKCYCCYQGSATFAVGSSYVVTRVELYVNAAYQGTASYLVPQYDYGINLATAYDYNGTSTQQIYWQGTGYFAETTVWWNKTSTGTSGTSDSQNLLF